MMLTSSITGIIADDLTGANDTALQFHIHGANTQILLNSEVDPLNVKSAQTWALSTETRNETPENAYHRVKEAAQVLVEKRPDKHTGLAKGVTKNYLNVYIENNEPDIFNTIQNVKILNRKDDKLFCNII